jgi:hypothetical protein
MPRAAEPKFLQAQPNSPPRRVGEPWVKQPVRSPYEDAVLCADPKVSLLIDGEIQRTEKISFTNPTRSHLVAVAAENVTFTLLVNELSGLKKLQCSGTTSLFTSESVIDISIGNIANKQCEDALDMFQTNDACGALKLSEMVADIDSDLCSFHRYCSRSGEEWVVLNTEAKRVNVLERPTKFTSLLSSACKILAKVNGETLCDTFRYVSLGNAHRPLLASNFTVLKKFLLKHNDAFLWRQDNADRATRICARN